MNKRGFPLPAQLALPLLCGFFVSSGVEARQILPVPDQKPPQQAQPTAPNQLTHISVAPSDSLHGFKVPLIDCYLYSQSSSELQTDNYLSEIAGEGLYHWLPERFPLRVYIEPGNRVPGYQPNFKSVLTSSLDQWCQASNGYLSWREVNEKDQADLVCRWTEQAPELDQGTEAGRTRIYTSLNVNTNRGIIKHATMDLLTNPPNRNFTADEIKKAYLHECGHAFGLSGHSSERTDIMSAVVTKSQPASLSRRDIASIRQLYSDFSQHPEQAMSQPSSVQSSSAVSRD